MSCDGWSVGDRCRCIASFNAIEKQIGGPDIVTPINSGDQGVVQSKIDRVPHSHILYVLWNRLRTRPLPVQDHQIRNIAKAAPPSPVQVPIPS
jgi:hypothetical protein